MAISFVQFSTGYRADLARLGAACRRHGALLVVDAIQGLGAVPLDVRAAGVDVLASGGQKWLCSPWGTGFVYVRRDLVRSLERPLPGWLAFEASQDFTRLLDYRYTLVEDARRFEAGTPGFQDFVGFVESVSLIRELGVERVWSRIREVQAPLRRWAAETDGVEIAGDPSPEHASGIVCVRLPGLDEAFQELGRSGVTTVMREGSIRFSPHFYNGVGDMERVVAILDGVVAAQGAAR